MVLRGLIGFLLCGVGAFASGVDTARDFSFAGSIPAVQIDSDGVVHAVYIDLIEEERRVMYRRGGEAPGMPISPAGVGLSHWPESTPILEITEDGAVHVVYTARVSGGDGSSGVELRYVVSRDGGVTWSPHRVVNTESLPAYRACVSSARLSDGSLQLSWLEGRGGNVGVHIARIDGESVEYDGTPFDAKACECCATELLSAGNGEIWLAYRDVSELNVRDFHVSRRTPGGDFGETRRISEDGWVIDGCPDSGARLTTDDQGRVWAAWFTGHPAGVYASYAVDDGMRFMPRIPVALQEGDLEFVAHPEIGRLPDGRLVVLYEARRGGESRIEARTTTAGGDWSDPIVVGTDAAYPRFTTNGDRSVIAFTQHRDDGPVVVVRAWSGIAAGH